MKNTQQKEPQEQTKEQTAAEVLIRDIALYKQEKKREQKLFEAISGQSYYRKNLVANIVFLVGMGILYALESTKIISISLSLQLGVLLVSVKIIWMIHINAKFYHFQFWILHSLEQRVTQIHSMLMQNQPPAPTPNKDTTAKK